MRDLRHQFNNTISPVINKALLILSILLLITVILDLFFNNKFIFLYQILYTPLWIIFAIEYCSKIIFSKNKIGYILKDPFGILIIVFPFLRPFGLLPISRFGILFLFDQLREQFPWVRKYRVLEFIMITVIIILFSADLLLILENEPGANIKTFSDAIWFSISTISTVGYGDLYPKTVAGRMLATVLLIFGVAFFGTITARIASFYIDAEVKHDLRTQVEKMKRLTEEEQRVENLVEKVYAKEKKMEDEIENLKI